LANKAALQVGSDQFSVKESQIRGQHSCQSGAVWQGREDQAVAVARRRRDVCVL